eukprot:s1818_g4.t1
MCRKLRLKSTPKRRAGWHGRCNHWKNMASNGRRIACGAALSAGAMLAAPSFLAPGATPARQSGLHAPLQPRVSSSSAFSSIPVATVASSAVLAVAARSATKQTSKTVRNFFGDSGSTSYASFDPATELGVQEPIGFWDPLGLSADKDQATFKRRRAVEIKHGRIAMYATMGYIVPEYFKFPGYLSPSLGLKFSDFSDVPNGLAALSKIPVLGGAQIIAFCGLIETTGFFQASSTTDGRGPREGQFSMKDSTESAEPPLMPQPKGLNLGKVEDPEARKTKLAAELANGRLAMMAIIGMFFQDGLTGSAWGDWALYTASPLRAEAEEEAPKPPPFDPAKQAEPKQLISRSEPWRRLVSSTLQASARLETRMAFRVFAQLKSSTAEMMLQGISYYLLGICWVQIDAPYVAAACAVVFQFLALNLAALDIHGVNDLSLIGALPSILTCSMGYNATADAFVDFMEKLEMPIPVEDDRPWADFPTAERRKDPFSGTVLGPFSFWFGTGVVSTWFYDIENRYRSQNGVLLDRPSSDNILDLDSAMAICMEFKRKVEMMTHGAWLKLEPLMKLPIEVKTRTRMSVKGAESPEKQLSLQQLAASRLGLGILAILRETKTHIFDWQVHLRSFGPACLACRAGRRSHIVEERRLAAVQVSELVFQPLNISWPYGGFFSPEAVSCQPTGAVFVGSTFAQYTLLDLEDPIQLLEMPSQDIASWDVPASWRLVCDKGSLECLWIEQRDEMLTLHANRTGIAGLERPLTVELGSTVGSRHRFLAGSLVSCASLEQDLHPKTTSRSCLLLVLGDGNEEAVVAHKSWLYTVQDRSAAPEQVDAVYLDVVQDAWNVIAGYWTTEYLTCERQVQSFNRRASEAASEALAFALALAMESCSSLVVQHYVKFPGFEGVPAGLGAVTTAPGTYGFAALFLLSGAMELGVWTQDIPCPWAVRAGRTLRGSVALGSLQDPSKEAGDFGDPLGRAPRAAVAQWPGLLRPPLSCSILYPVSCNAPFDP